MDVDKLAIDLLLKGMTKEQQNAALDSIKESVTQAKAVQKQRIGENVQVVVQALKKLEADIKARYDETGKAIEKRVASIKNGKDGQNGINGKDGRDGRPGRDGATGARGNDGMPGRNGIDGVDGVSVTNAFIDFDGSLIINLSSGQTLNVGEVVAPDLAEKIKVITNGGGTSQQVLDTLISLQNQINNLIPSQTGNAGKFLTTDGTDVSWASVAGGLTFEGTWNASTNTPTLASGVGVNGEYYITDTAGSTNLDGITDWEIGDWLLFNGTVWQKIDQSNLVTSVNGQVGVVSLTTTNINEGTNLYYTDVRARDAISAGTGISYDSATGVVTNAAPDQTVSLTGAGTTSISGTYPNFTITSADSTVGTVTSVGGTGTVFGISLSGTVTSSGNLTLGGSLDLSSPPTIGNTAPNTGRFSTLTVDDNSTFGTSNTDTVTFTARADSEFSPATDDTHDLGRVGHEWRNLFIDGTANIDSLIADTADINGGTIDGTTIGATTASTGAFTTLAVNTITNAAGGNTAQINGQTPSESNMQGRNRIINGDMRIAQRGTAAVTTAGSFPVDRMRMTNITDGAFSAQQDSSAPAGFTNSTKITTTTADATLTTTQSLLLEHRLEGVNTYDLAWGTANAKTVTVSFWVRSSLTGTFGGALQNSAQDRSYPFTYTISVADTWEYKTIEIEGDTSGTWLTTTGIGLRLAFGLGAGPDRSGTAGAWASANFFSATGAVSVIGTLDATWFVTGVQLEAGAVATPFERRPFGAELALCQRYYEVIGGGQTLTLYVEGYAGAVTGNWTFKVEKRATPTMAATGTFATSNVSGGIVITPSTTAFNAYYVVTSTGRAFWHNVGAASITASIEL